MLDIVLQAPYNYPHPEPATRVQREIFNVLYQPEQPEYIISCRTAIGDVPPRMRSFIKSLRIRSSEVYKLYNSGVSCLVPNTVHYKASHHSHRFVSSVHVDPMGAYASCPRKDREAKAKSLAVENDELSKFANEFGNPGMSVRRVYRIVNPKFPFLITTPDAVVFQKSGKPVGLVEVKKTRGDPFRDYSGPMMSKKEHHKIIRDCATWFQIQTSLAITNLEWCMLVSYSELDKKTVKTMVMRDEKEICSIINDMCNMYFDDLMRLYEHVLNCNGIM